MRRTMFVVVLAIVAIGLLAYFKSQLKAEEVQMQSVIKIDPVTKDELEFKLQLYNRNDLKKLIPSIITPHDEKFEKEDFPYMKYVFCNVVNKSKRNAVKVRFRIISPNSPLHSPELTMLWLPPSGESNYPGEYVLVYLANPSLGIQDSEVKFDIEIIDIQRK